METDKNITFIDRAPKPGEVTSWLQKNNIKLLVGHPTYQTHDNAARLVRSDIEALNKAFPETTSAIIVSDGSFTKKMEIYVH